MCLLPKNAIFDAETNYFLRTFIRTRLFCCCGRSSVRESGHSVLRVVVCICAVIVCFFELRFGLLSGLVLAVVRVFEGDNNWNSQMSYGGLPTYRSSALVVTRWNA